MKKAMAVAFGLLLLVLLVLFSTTYTVRFHEVAVKRTFGKTSEVSIQDEPGVHFRLPLFADSVTTYDTRLQLSETPLVEVATADGQSVVVKAFLMWRINPDDVLQFANSYPSGKRYPRSMLAADRDVTASLLTEVKSSLGALAFDDLIGGNSKLPMAEAAILRQMATLGSNMGIVPETVGISQVQLPAKVTKAVLGRMEATRSALAEAERSKGRSRAVAIESEANSTADRLRAFAEQRADEIKGQANQKAAAYLSQMSEDESFAIFLVWLDALRSGLEHNTTFFLSDEAAPWHLLNQAQAIDAGYLPQPENKYFRVSNNDETVPADRPVSDGS